MPSNARKSVLSERDKKSSRDYLLADSLAQGALRMEDLPRASASIDSRGPKRSQPDIDKRREITGSAQTAFVDRIPLQTLT